MGLITTQVKRTKTIAQRNIGDDLALNNHFSTCFKEFDFLFRFHILVIPCSISLYLSGLSHLV